VILGMIAQTYCNQEPKFRLDVGTRLAEFLILEVVGIDLDRLTLRGRSVGHRRIGPESCPLGVSGVGIVAATSDRDEPSFKLSVTRKTVSVTEKLSATARNVGNKRFSTADSSAAPPSN
jgi:hypothetical protein